MMTLTLMLQQEADYKRLKEGKYFTRGKAKNDMQRASGSRWNRAGPMQNCFQIKLLYKCRGRVRLTHHISYPTVVAKHKPRKNQKGVEGKVAGRGRKKSITPPTLSAILQRLNQAEGSEC